MEMRKRRAGRTFVDEGLFLDVTFDVLGEPLVELIVGVKQSRHYEV